MTTVLNTPIALVLLVVIGTALGGGCGAVEYGFAPEYSPTQRETPYWQMGQELPFDEVAAHPERYRTHLLSWFGVISQVSTTNTGRYRIILDYYRHESRHQCQSDDAHSCRVTVAGPDLGRFVALVEPTNEPHSALLQHLRPGALLRVYGRLHCFENRYGHAQCATTPRGHPIVDVAFYRHWPRRYYRVLDDRPFVSL